LTKSHAVKEPQRADRLVDVGPRCNRAALTTAYGAGLRVGEMARLETGAIDSGRMLIRIEQGKGSKDRYVMLSPQLLRILRAYWRLARPGRWLFPGQDAGVPVSVATLQHACRVATQAAELNKPVTAVPVSGGEPQARVWSSAALPPAAWWRLAAAHCSAARLSNRQHCDCAGAHEQRGQRTQDA
jgi:integrase-like protein